MADPSVGKATGQSYGNGIDEARRSSVASINLNKNTDAKYAKNLLVFDTFLTASIGYPIL